MFSLKIIFKFFHLILILLMTQLSLAQFEVCDKMVIEGGSHALKKIFADFNEIKHSISVLKSSVEECPRRPEIPQKDQPLFDIRYDALPQKCATDILPKNCAEATSCTRRSGIYKIQVSQYGFEPFYVECDAETENGDWILIQRRQDGSEDFYRNWQEYEKGFGEVDKEFFIGLKNLYDLTNFNGPQELLIILEHANGTKAYAKYDTFAIGNATDMYKLKSLGKYSGSAGDSFTVHLGMKFTTKDRDNDTENKFNCAVTYTGAWWYKACHQCNLNGKYGDDSFGKGINWLTFGGRNTSLRYVKMMIRRRRINS